MYQLEQPISALVVYWVRPQHALISSEAKQILPVADVQKFLPTLPGIFTPTHPAFTTMSIATLIQAAEWLERRERGVNSLGNWIKLSQFLCWNFQRLKSHAFSTWRPCLFCGLLSLSFWRQYFLDFRIGAWVCIIDAYARGLHPKEGEVIDQEAANPSPRISHWKQASRHFCFVFLGFFCRLDKVIVQPETFYFPSRIHICKVSLKITINLWLTSLFRGSESRIETWVSKPRWRTVRLWLATTSTNQSITLMILTAVKAQSENLIAVSA